MAKKEYIERETKLKEIDRAFKEYEQNGDILRLFSECRASIIYAPAADVVEVRHGHWIKRGNEKKCSVCGFIYYSNNDDWNGCPNCLAKMDGGKTE